jgi:hypothetical protein
LLKFATLVGTPGNGRVVKFVALHTGAARLVKLIAPKTVDVPLNPECVRIKYTPIIAIVGGTQTPEVVGDNGVFAEVTPEIVTNVPAALS